MSSGLRLLSCLGLVLLTQTTLAQEPAKPQAGTPPVEEAVTVDPFTTTATAPKPKAPCQLSSEFTNLSATYDLTLHTRTSSMLTAVPQGLEHYQLTLDIESCEISGELLKVGEDNTVFPVAKREKVSVTWLGFDRTLVMKTTSHPSEPAVSPRTFIVALPPLSQSRKQTQPAGFYGLWHEGPAGQTPSQWGPLKGQLRQKHKNKVALVTVYQGLCDHQQVEAKGGAPAFVLTQCGLGEDGAAAFVSDFHTWFKPIMGLPETYDASKTIRVNAPLHQVRVDLSQDTPVIQAELSLRAYNMKTKKRAPRFEGIMPIIGTFKDGDFHLESGEFLPNVAQD